MGSDHVVRFEQRHVQAAAEVLAEAFAPEPFWECLLPNARTREQRLHATFRLVVRYGLRFGEVWGDENVDSVAVWLPSSHATPSLWHEVQCGGLRVLASHGPAAVLREMRVAAHTASVRERLVPETHEYLWVLAVRRSRQGAGLGSRLLRTRLGALDEQGRIAYLETHQPRNVPLYERYGFAVRQKHQIPKTKISQWSMVRPPQ